MAVKGKQEINKLHLGFIAGLIIPLLVFVLMYFVSGHKVSIADYVSGLWQIQALIKLLTLCVVPNLLLFLYFFKKKYDMAARGVLMATFIYAFIVIISRAF